MATIHQVNSKAIRNAEALPKLSLRKEFDRLFRMGAIDTFSWPTTFLALTSRTGRSNTPRANMLKQVSRVRPAQ